MYYSLNPTFDTWGMPYTIPFSIFLLYLFNIWQHCIQCMILQTKEYVPPFSESFQCGLQDSLIFLRLLVWVELVPTKTTKEYIYIRMLGVFETFLSSFWYKSQYTAALEFRIKACKLRSLITKPRWAILLIYTLSIMVTTVILTRYAWSRIHHTLSPKSINSISNIRGEVALAAMVVRTSKVVISTCVSLSLQRVTLSVLPTTMPNTVAISAAISPKYLDTVLNFCLQLENQSLALFVGF